MCQKKEIENETEKNVKETEKKAEKENENEKGPVINIETNRKI